MPEQFQSTLAPVGASEIISTYGDGGTNEFQSTLAPVGASEAMFAGVSVGFVTFQSTLAPVGASEAASQSPSEADPGFNPRSHPWVRANHCLRRLHHPSSVSIHARTRGCERTRFGWTPPRPSEFQSTLAPVGASETAGVALYDGRKERFNPRSHPWVRAKFSNCRSTADNRVSIHARTRGCERSSLSMY